MFGRTISGWRAQEFTFGSGSGSRTRDSNCVILRESCSWPLVLPLANFQKTIRVVCG